MFLRLNEIVKAGGQIEADRMLDLLTVMEGNAQIEEIGLVFPHLSRM